MRLSYSWHIKFALENPGIGQKMDDRRLLFQTCAHTLMHTHTCIHALTHTHMHTRTHTHTYVHTHTRMHTHLWMHTHCRHAQMYYEKARSPAIDVWMCLN